MDILAKILSSQTRASIFRLLFGGGNDEFYMRDIEKRTGLSIGTIQQELPKLEKQGLIQSRKDGNRLYFQANIEHPIYQDICKIVFKTSGWMATLKNALNHEGIECAFVFGSIARKEEKATSDIDLVVIGSLGLRELSGLMGPIGRQAEREINPHVYTKSEFKKRLHKKNHFVSQILESEKLFIIGNENDIKKLG